MTYLFDIVRSLWLILGHINGGSSHEVVLASKIVIIHDQLQYLGLNET